MIASLKFNKGQLRKRKTLQDIEDFYEEHAAHPHHEYTKNELLEKEFAKRYAYKIERKRKIIGTLIALIIAAILVYLILML